MNETTFVEIVDSDIVAVGLIVVDDETCQIEEHIADVAEVRQAFTGGVVDGVVEDDRLDLSAGYIKMECDMGMDFFAGLQRVQVLKARVDPLLECCGYVFVVVLTKRKPLGTD